MIRLKIFISLFLTLILNVVYSQDLYTITSFPDESTLNGIYIFPSECDYKIDFSFLQQITATQDDTPYTFIGITQDAHHSYSFNFIRIGGKGLLETSVTLFNGTIFQLNTNIEYNCIPIPNPLELKDNSQRKVEVFDSLQINAGSLEFKNDQNISIPITSISCYPSCNSFKYSIAAGLDRYHLSFTSWTPQMYQTLNNIMVSVDDKFGRSTSFSFTIFNDQGTGCTTQPDITVSQRSIAFNDPSFDHFLQLNITNNICHYIYFIKSSGTTAFFFKPKTGNIVNSTYVLAFNYRGSLVSNGAQLDVNSYFISQSLSGLLSNYQFNTPNLPAFSLTSKSSSFYNQTNPTIPLLNYEITYNSFVSNDRYQYFGLNSFGSFNSQFLYPYGYSMGTLQNFDFKFSLPFTDSYFSPYFTLTFNDQNFIQPIEQSKTVFNEPDLVSYQYTKLSNRLIMVTMNINDPSGFLAGVKEGKVVISSNDLVNGTLNSGIYQYVFDLANTQLQSLDIVNQGFVKKTNYFNSLTPVVGYSEIFNLANFTNVLVEHQYANLTGLKEPFKNKLFFNVTNPDPNLVFLFFVTTDVPYYLSVWSTFHDSVCYWSLDISVYQFTCDFSVAPNLFTNIYQYYLFLMPTQAMVDSSQINLMFPNSTFHFESDNADELPPMVSSLTGDTYKIDFTNNPLDQSVNVELKITDSVNGLKDGYVIFTSEYDPVGFNFSLNPSLSTNNDIYNPVFNLKLNFTNNCVSQSYTISDMLLEDNARHKSTYVTHKLYPIMDFVSPLYFVEPQLPIDIICQPSTDTTPPTLTSFAIKNTNPLDVGLWNRQNVEIEFTVEDTGSGLSTRHIPTIFLTDLFLTRIETKAVKVSQTSTTPGIVSSATYSCSIPVPWGYGSVNGISLSLYGIMDNHMNFRGYSTVDLETTFGQSIVKTLLSTDTPILQKVHNVAKSEVLFIGHYFDNETIVEVKYTPHGKFISVPIINYIDNIVLSIQTQVREAPMIFRVTRSGKVSNEIILNNNKPFPVDPSSSSSSSQVSSESQITSSSSEVIVNPCKGEPLCGGPSKGTCISSGCKCKYPAIGIDCSSVIIDVPVPSINNTAPDTFQQVDIDGKSVTYSSLVSVYSIQEISGVTNEVVKEDVFSRWILSDLSTSVSPNHYLYQSSFTHADSASGTDVTTNVNVTIQWFTQSSQIQFGKRVLDINANSMKYNIKMDKYPFKSQLNKLHVVMKAQLSSNGLDEVCSDSRSGNTSDNNQYIQLQVNDHSLYGRFIKTALIDGAEKVISNFIEKDTQTTSSSASSVSVSIQVPFYTKKVELDPDFSLLVDTKPAADQENSICSSSSSSLTKAQLAGIIIGCVGFVAVVTICTIFYIKKRRDNQAFIEKINRASQF